MRKVQFWRFGKKRRSSRARPIRFRCAGDRGKCSDAAGLLQRPGRNLELEDLSVGVRESEAQDLHHWIDWRRRNERTVDREEIAASGGTEADRSRVATDQAAFAVGIQAVDQPVAVVVDEVETDLRQVAIRRAIAHVRRLALLTEAGLDDAVAAGLGDAVGVATVLVDGVAVVALLGRIVDDAITTPR